MRFGLDNKTHPQYKVRLNNALALDKLNINKLPEQEAENIKLGCLRIANAINIATVPTFFIAMGVMALAHSAELSNFNFDGFKQDITPILTFVLLAIAVSSLLKKLFFISLNNCKMNDIKDNKFGLENIPMFCGFYGRLSLSLVILAIGTSLYSFKMNLDQAFIAANQINSIGYSIIESFILLFIVGFCSIGGLMLVSTLLNRVNYFKMIAIRSTQNP